MDTESYTRNARDQLRTNSEITINVCITYIMIDESHTLKYIKI